MHVQRLTDGLWRWTAPHPRWTPAADGPEGARRLDGTDPGSVGTDDLPWADAPGILDDPALPLLYYSVETVLNDVRALPDAATRTVVLTW